MRYTLDSVEGGLGERELAPGGQPDGRGGGFGDGFPEREDSAGNVQ